MVKNVDSSVVEGWCAGLLGKGLVNTQGAKN